MAGGLQICLSTSNHLPDGFGQASKIGTRPDHDHTLLARSELVPISSNRATKKVLTFTLASMECNNLGSNSKDHEKHTVHCLEAHITICVKGASEKKMPGKSLTP